MHGSYDIHSYADVAPMLAERGLPGHRAVPAGLRRHALPRASHAALGRTGRAGRGPARAARCRWTIDRAALAGYDWGGRAACVVAALWPERCAGLVSLNSYNIQNIARAMEPGHAAENEHRLWYQYYFHSERGRAGCAPTGEASPSCCGSSGHRRGSSTTPTFERSAAAFDHPDFVDVVIHSYRHRFGLGAGRPGLRPPIERRLAAQPPITVPADHLRRHRRRRAARPRMHRPTRTASRGPRSHRLVPGAGHNMPQEAPRTFARCRARTGALRCARTHDRRHPEDPFRTPLLRRRASFPRSTPRARSACRCASSVYLPPRSQSTADARPAYPAGLTCNEETFCDQGRRASHGRELRASR